MDLDEVAHDEPPHQDRRCLQNQLFSILVLIELKSLMHFICSLLKPLHGKL